MKILIVHNSNFGNGEKLAQTLGEALKKGNDVTVEHIKNLSPKKVVEDSFDAIIAGSYLRAFMISRKSRTWLGSVRSSLKKANKTIKYGVAFLTHALPPDGAKKWLERMVKELQKDNVIVNVFPECLSGQVADIKGPFVEGTIESITAKGSEIIEWMKK
jgi:menaquinone-dependent protoporphyrinogen IX oxidase